MISRLLLALTLVGLTSSCALLAPLFSLDQRAEPAGNSPYQAAMADFSLCETAPDPAARAAAADRLSRAAAAMAAETQPTSADHVYQLDRVTAASARCQASLIPSR